MCDVRYCWDWFGVTGSDVGCAAVREVKQLLEVSDGQAAEEYWLFLLRFLV